MLVSRRKFIKHSLLASSGTLLIPSFLKALEHPATTLAERKVVVIQLSGGNDGLNTVVPYRNDVYYKSRPGIAVSSAQVLKASNELGFNPGLTKLNDLYDRGYLAVLNNVGYPNPDRSHFRSMDIWQSASGSESSLTTGWVGRFLDASCNGCATHRAIELDDTLSLALKGDSMKGMAMKNPEKLYRSVHDTIFNDVVTQNLLNDVEGQSLRYLYKTMAETKSSAELIHQHAIARSSQATYPDTEFSKRLKTIAELIKADLNTRVYYVSLAGFDTHVNQQNQHQRLLETYANGVHAFITDLGSQLMKDVLILTFSEFGRRVTQNGSGGTDHGTANNVFLFSGSLKQKGFINESPDLSSLDEGDLIHRVDFRSVYASILEKWLEVPSQNILKRSFSTLDFI
ncbi:MAG TPA: DUF1501 domain-containing protein [Chryseolinea sp.]|nr:DUF1501 domain-containing protein [Chryseolinea sp.]